MKKPHIAIPAFFIFFIIQLFLTVGMLQAQTTPGEGINTEKVLLLRNRPFTLKTRILISVKSIKGKKLNIAEIIENHPLFSACF